MYNDIITTHEKVFLRSFRGGSTTKLNSRRWSWCSGVLCVVVVTVLVLIIASVVTVRLVQEKQHVWDKEVVSVMSKEEQRRLILLARQDCYRLDQQRKQQTLNGSEEINKGCEVVFDDVLCWDVARPGSYVTQSCPDYINGFNRNGNATRFCTENGTWYFNKEHNNTWTNYSQCMEPFIDLTFHAAHGERLRQLYTVGYSVSLSTLLVALIIMLCCKRLHSKSNTLHINLFLAFSLRAIISFLKDKLFVGNVGLAKDVWVDESGMLHFVNGSLHWECKLLFTVFMYSVSVCNMWILAEAVYLTMLVQRPLRTERRGVRIYVILGWMMPFLFLVPWIVVKAIYENTLCWNIQQNSQYYWILRGAGVAVVVINFFLFLNIFRKLFMKIRHSSELGASGNAKYRKLAKFILVLIPLFGIMYIVFYVAVPSGFEDYSYNVSYLYLEMTYNSFQGFLLALLFCFLNEEVLGELKRLWYRYRYKKGDPTAFTRSFAASSYRKTPGSSSIRCPSSILLTRSTQSLSGSQLALQKLRNLSSSSSQLPRAPDLLTDLEKRRMRLKKAQSHDLEIRKDSSDRELNDELLRQAIKGNLLAKREALRRQRTVDSATSQEDSLSNHDSPPSTPNQCVTIDEQDEDKVHWDKNRNSSNTFFL